jgi:phosphoribosyl 1,2-cyclic phosphate phosphodiesterase
MRARPTHLGIHSPTNDVMEVTLLGTGDTTGTPTVGCECDTCTAARRRGVERTRFSVHIHNERTDQSLLVDASPDFRQQFLREDLPVPDSVVCTHIHFDHLHGLGNVFRLTRSLPVHAADETDPKTGESVAETVGRKYDYLSAVDVHAQSPFEAFETAGLECRLVPVDHPPLVCYGLIVEDPETGAKLSFSGDTTYDVPAESRDALDDPDLLLADGIVPATFCDTHRLGGKHPDEDGVPRTFGTKHMTFEGARALASDLSATEHRLVHVSHFPPPAEAFGEDLAVDGERFEL